MADRTDGEAECLSESNVAALLAEYNALRTEILKRIEFRHRLNALALTTAGVFLGVGLSENYSIVALILPFLVPFLALSWVHNDLRVGDLARYIRIHTEGHLPAMQWETQMFQSRKEGSGRRRWRRTVLGQTGVFAVIQLLALTIGLHGGSEDCFVLALVGLGAAMVVLMLAIMSRGILHYRKPKQALGGGA